MDASFIPIETVPSVTAFGLSQIRRSYKSALSATDAIIAAPALGTDDESVPNFFLTFINTPETAESATRIDLVYMGCFGGSEGSPVLPAQKHDTEDTVQSATSSMGSSTIILKSPLTIQYYAPSNTLSYFSFGGPGTDVATDPADDPEIITVVCGDGTFTPTSIIGDLVAFYFSELITHSFKSTEIVPGQYWQNVSRKTKGYVPLMFNLTAGAYINIYSPGVGYTVGDTLTITAGGQTAVLVVTALGASGSVNGFNVSSNTFTTAHTLTATGGSGTGAGFNVFIIS